METDLKTRENSFEEINLNKKPKTVYHNPDGIYFEHSGVVFEENHILSGVLQNPETESPDWLQFSPELR